MHECVMLQLTLTGWTGRHERRARTACKDSTAAVTILFQVVSLPFQLAGRMSEQWERTAKGIEFEPLAKARCHDIDSRGGQARNRGLLTRGRAPRILWLIAGLILSHKGYGVRRGEGRRGEGKGDREGVSEDVRACVCV